MRYENLSKSSVFISEIHELYESSFPRNEKMKWSDLVNRISTNDILTAYFTDDDKLAGFTYLFVEEPAAYLSYFAVKPELRGQGYGSEILKTLQSAIPSKKIIIDIEELNDQTPNAQERQKRRNFYLHNGFQETGIFYNIYHVDYELLSINGKAVRSDWNKITHKIWGKFADKIVYRGDSL